MVLAGGRSLRMGRNKALLVIGGQSLLRRSVELLGSLGLARVVVSGDYPGFDCLTDSYPQLGPLAGLHAGCLHFGDQSVGELSPGEPSVGKAYQGILLLPVDMPLMSAVPLRRLLLQPAGGYYRRAMLPALVPFSHDLRHRLEVRLSAEGNNRSVGRLFDELGLPVMAIPPQEQAQFSNSNTPEEWQACINAFS